MNPKEEDSENRAQKACTHPSPCPSLFLCGTGGIQGVFPKAPATSQSFPRSQHPLQGPLHRVCTGPVSERNKHESYGLGGRGAGSRRGLAAALFSPALGAGWRLACGAHRQAVPAHWAGLPFPSHPCALAKTFRPGIGRGEGPEVSRACSASLRQGPLSSRQRPWPGPVGTAPPLQGSVHSLPVPNPPSTLTPPGPPAASLQHDPQGHCLTLTHPSPHTQVSVTDLVLRRI